MVTVHDLATEARRYFVRDKRANGDEFVKCSEDAPEWLGELVHHAHGDMLPDDWRYELISDAIDALADNDDVDDARDALPGYEMTYQAAAWLGSRADRYGYADEEAKERGGFGTFDSVIDIIQAGLNREQREVFDLVVEWLEEEVDE